MILYRAFKGLLRACNAVFCVSLCWNRFQRFKGLIRALKIAFLFCDRFRNAVCNYGISILRALQGFLRLYRFLVYRNTLKRNKGIQGKLDTLQSILKHGAMIVRYPGHIPELIGIVRQLSENSDFSDLLKFSSSVFHGKSRL